MKMLKSLALLLSLVVLPAFGQEAGGPFQDGATLHAQLVEFVTRNSQSSVQDQFTSFTGAGYVVGVADALNGAIFCVPSGVTKGEVIAVVLKFLNDHPADWHYPAAQDVAVALHLSYPCAAKHAG